MVCGPCANDAYPSLCPDGVTTACPESCPVEADRSPGLGPPKSLPDDVKIHVHTLGNEPDMMRRNRRRSLVEGTEYLDYTPVYDYKYWVNATEKRIYYELYFDYLRAKQEKDKGSSDLRPWEIEVFFDEFSY